MTDHDPSDSDAQPIVVVVETTSPRSAPFPVGLLTAVGVLGVALVGLVIAWNPWFGLFNGSREVADLDDRSAAAETAACEAAIILFTYDSSKIDEYFAALQRISTGRFGSGFADDKDQLRTLITRSQVVSRLSEPSCAEQMIGEDNARVRIQGTQILDSGGDGQGPEQSDRIDIDVDMEWTDDGWKVADINALGNGPSSRVAGAEPVPVNPPAPGVDPGDGEPMPSAPPVHTDVPEPVPDR